MSMEMRPSRVTGEDIAEPSTIAKGDIDFVESTKDDALTSNSNTVAARLSESHRDYMIERHNTLDLDPIPGMGPADPYNWPEWKVCKLVRTQ